MCERWWLKREELTAKKEKADCGTPGPLNYVLSGAGMGAQHVGDRTTRRSSEVRANDAGEMVRRRCENVSGWGVAEQVAMVR